MKKVSLFILSIIIFAACDSGPKKTFTIELNNINFEAEGPFFEGPNTFQAELGENFSAIFEENGADINDISSVKLKDAAVFSKEGENFDLFENFLLQFFGDNFPLTKVASLSSVEKNQTSLSLNPSNEADVKSLFKEETIFVIVDANLNDEFYDDLSFKGKVVLEITAKEK